jgi:small-conductance mechanosensitive channel
VPLANRLLDARGVDAHAKRPLVRLTKVAVVFVALAVAFGRAGYGNLLTSLATIAAAATLAVGFALQDVIKNFVAGVFVYTDRPFRVGDWIEWGGPNGGYAGIVEDISLRVTRVRTFDNELLTVPNSVLTDGVIKNPVAKDRLRITFTFGIGYEDDIERATAIIVEEASAHAAILNTPSPTVQMAEEPLADSSVGLVALFWIADPTRPKFLRVRSEFVRNVKQRFDEAGIEIPFPQVALSGSVGIDDSARRRNRRLTGRDTPNAATPRGTARCGRGAADSIRTAGPRARTGWLPPISRGLTGSTPNSTPSTRTTPTSTPAGSTTSTRARAGPY